MDQGQTPVNPYAPAGAPYAPGSNTPPPTFATPAVPNTAATPTPDPAYTSFSTSSSPVFTPDQPPQKERFFSKKFIIFASVGLALIVAAIITGLILQNNRNNGGTGGATANYNDSRVIADSSSGYVEALNIFYNYISTNSQNDAKAYQQSTDSTSTYLYNAVKENFIGQKDDGEYFYTNSGNVTEIDSGAMLFSNVSERDAFMTLAKQYSDRVYQENSNYTDGKKTFDAIYDIYSAHVVLDQDAIREYLAQNGEDATKRYLEIQYPSLVNSDNQIVYDYVATQNEYISNLIAYFKTPSDEKSLALFDESLNAERYLTSTVSSLFSGYYTLANMGENDEN